MNKAAVEMKLRSLVNVLDKAFCPGEPYDAQSVNWVHNQLQYLVDAPIEPEEIKPDPITHIPEDNAHLDKAIELLSECSSLLFMTDADIVLENEVDKFLSENGKCTTKCDECKNCPTSLKPQAS